MTHKLSQLLSNDHPLFSRSMYELELASGNAGIDAKLLGDITERAHVVMRELGLDPADTHARELYYALNSCISSDQNRLFASTHYVLLFIDEELVSFCLQDVIENAHHELAFEDRGIGHAQRHLRLEIVKRYADHDRTNNNMVHELASQVGMKRASDAEHTTLEPREEGGTVTDSTNQPYIFAIGDIFTDDFIELDPEEAVSFTDENEKKHLMMPFGSKPPYLGAEKVTSVGPSPNAAVSFARLGAEVGLRAFLGDDETAKESAEYLKSENVDVASLSMQEGLKSNYYYVLRLGADRTILVKNEAYDYVWLDPPKKPDWIYLSLLSNDSWRLHEQLLDYLKKYPDVKLAFQPGTFHFEWGVEKLSDIYGRSFIVVMNREEAVDVTGRSYDSLADLFAGLHELGPEIAVITDGPNGSYASFEGKTVTIPNYPDPGPPVDRTGAGDAFASTIVAALAMGETMETALSWAPINSMNVVQYLGAQRGLLSKEEIQKYLEQAPEEYGVSPLEA